MVKDMYIESIELNNYRNYRKVKVEFGKNTNILYGNNAQGKTNIETVKKALFNNQDEADEIKKAFRKYRPESILILGTSDNMIKKIRENLG